MQNDEPSTHLSFTHSPEQQSADPPPSPAGAPLAVQGLPAVRQVVLRGAHFPPAQFWPQHSPDVVQAALSATQLLALAHTPRAVSHCRLQQSVDTLHELPAPLHTETDDLHLPLTVSHTLEQHWPSRVQASPATVHTTPMPPVPGVPESPSVACPSVGVPCPE